MYIELKETTKHVTKNKRAYKAKKKSSHTLRKRLIVRDHENN